MVRRYQLVIAVRIIFVVVASADFSSSEETPFKTQSGFMQLVRGTHISCAIVLYF